MTLSTSPVPHTVLMLRWTDNKQQQQQQQQLLFNPYT